jgi:hypothetical protein
VLEVRLCQDQANHSASTQCAFNATIVFKHATVLRDRIKSLGTKNICDICHPSLLYEARKYCRGKTMRSVYIPLSNYVQLSPSWGAASRSGSQCLSSSLWNLKVHYRVHNSPSLVPVLIFVNADLTNPPFPLSSLLTIYSHPCLGVSRCPFLSHFPTAPISLVPHKKLCGLSPRANYTDHATAACRRRQRKILQMQGCHVISITDPLRP